MTKPISWATPFACLIIALLAIRPAGAGAGQLSGWLGTDYQNGALTNTVQTIKPSAGTVWNYKLSNPGAAATTFEVFGQPATAVTLGTTTPIFHMTLQAGQSANIQLNPGYFGSTGLSCAAVASYNGATAPSTAMDVSVAFN